MKLFLRGKSPVQNKPSIQIHHGTADNPYMRIPPVSEFLFSADIFFCNIISASISYFVINYNYFSVISVIQPDSEKFQFRSEKESHFSSCRNIVLQDVSVQCSSTQRIHQKSYFKSFFCFLGKQLDQCHPHKITFDDIIFDINRFFRLTDIRHQLVHQYRSICDQFRIIIFRIVGMGVYLIQFDQMAPVFRCRTVERIVIAFHLFHLIP